MDQNQAPINLMIFDYYNYLYINMVNMAANKKICIN